MLINVTEDNENEDMYLCCLCGAIGDYNFGLKLVECDDCKYLKYACPSCQKEPGVRVLTHQEAKIIESKTGGLEGRFLCVICGKTESAHDVEQLMEKGWSHESGDWSCGDCVITTEDETTTITCYGCGTTINIDAPMWFAEGVHAGLTAEYH